MMVFTKGWNRLNQLLCLLFIALLVLIFGTFFEIYYDGNDDMMIKDILAGVYTGTPDGHNIQMLFPIAAFISLFYRLFPSIPWYGFFLYLFQVLSFYLLSIRIISYVQTIRKKVVILLVEGIFIVGLLAWELVFVQYTVTSAILAATAFFLFYTTEDSLAPGKFFKANIISILLAIVSFNIRTEMFLLVFPFFLSLVFFKCMNVVKAQKVKKYISVLAGTVGGIVLSLIINAMAYNTVEWQHFNTFFDNRTEIYDFLGIPSFEENTELYQAIGMKESSQILLENYNFGIDDSIDEKKLAQIITYEKESGRGNYLKLSIKEGASKYINRLYHKTDAPWIYLIWVGYGILCFTAFINKNYSFIWKLLMLATARSVLWMYIILRDRMPLRITHSLFLTEFIVLVALISLEVYKLNIRIDKGPRPLYQKFWPTTLLTIITILAIGSLLQGVPKVKAEITRRELINKDWISLQEYCSSNPDNFYLLDVYSTVAYSEKIFKEVDNSLVNYEYAGGWACKSPLAAEKMSIWRLDSLETGLVEEDYVYFIAYSSQDILWMSFYYEDKGIPVIVEIEDTFGGGDDQLYQVYSVSLKK